MNEKFLKVDDVMQILGISKSAAYNIMRQLLGMTVPDKPSSPLQKYYSK